MSMNLKTTGLATSLSMCLAYDPDLARVREFVSSTVDSAMTVHANVTYGTGSWKSTALQYFETKQNGATNFYGVTFGGTKPSYPDGVGGSGIAFMVLVHAAGAGGTNGEILAAGGGGNFFFAGPIIYRGGIGEQGSTSLPDNGSGTKYAVGFNHMYGGTWGAFYGLESGALATDGSGADGGYGSNSTITSFGGEAGQGNKAGQWYMALVFNRVLTTSEYQSIHNDPLGTLFTITGDTTAPTLTSASGSGTSTTTASGSVTTDENNGTLYAICTTVATAPSVAQIQAGNSQTGAAAAYFNGGLTVSSTGSKSVNATGLTASTTYYWHFQHKDAAGNNSTVVSSASFATPSTGGSVIPAALLMMML